MVQSGLDSESALGLLKYLHNYARGKDRKTGKGRRVILTIHQPSSQIWEHIDNGNVVDVDYLRKRILSYLIVSTKCPHVTCSTSIILIQLFYLLRAVSSTKVLAEK
jgi:hypothetical protein